MTENKGGRNIRCLNCADHGILDASYHNPKECPECLGTGANWLYKNGSLAKYKGGPLIGSMSAGLLFKEKK